MDQCCVCVCVLCGLMGSAEHCMWCSMGVFQSIFGDDRDLYKSHILRKENEKTKMIVERSLCQMRTLLKICFISIRYGERETESDDDSFCFIQQIGCVYRQ